MSILASPYYLTTQRDDSSAKTTEQMIDCGDQSNYKTFFYHAIHGSDKCYFYKYKGPEGKLGFPNYEEMNGTSCDEFAQFCSVYGNTTTGKYFLLI